MKTHDFAKKKETRIPIKYPKIEANNIFLKSKYKALKEIKLKLDAITPDTMNLIICLLFLFKNLYNFKTINFQFK